MHNEFLNKFKQEHPDKEIIFLISAGSHFFNLNSPNSDFDFRGIYLPSAKTFYESEKRRKIVEYKTNSENSKNKSTDIDFTLFSITNFLDLLSRGDFNMMEMLYTPKDKIIINSTIMEELMEIKSSLIVNDISSFLGFIKREIGRYGTNINHYSVQERFLKFLEKYDRHTVLKEIWSDIEEYVKSENMISITTSETGHHQMVPTIKIAQRLFQNSIRVDYTREALIEKMSRYGHRSKAASGYCFKGIYHAMRLIMEAEDILEYGELKFPFDEKRLEYLSNIKNGFFEKEVILNDINGRVEILFEKEKKAVSNRNQVKGLIDKIIFNLESRKRIEYLCQKQSKNDS